MEALLSVVVFVSVAGGFVWLALRWLRPESHGEMLARDRDVERGSEPHPSPPGRHRRTG